MTEPRNNGLVATNLSVVAGKLPLLCGATLELHPGELVAVLGPNGAGKTTLLRAALGLQALESGTVTLAGADIRSWSPMERARRVSYLPQRRPLAWPNTVRDVVALGRFSHGAAPGRLAAADRDAVDVALEACDLKALQRRLTDTLSGGELARVHVARALSANAPLLLADEPVAALDPRHQLRVASLLRNFVNDGGGAVVVLHEVALAAGIADRLVFLNDGYVVAEGAPADILTSATMAAVYGVDAHIHHDERGYDVRITGAA